MGQTPQGVLFDVFENVRCPRRDKKNRLGAHPAYRRRNEVKDSEGSAELCGWAVVENEALRVTRPQGTNNIMNDEVEREDVSNSLVMRVILSNVRLPHLEAIDLSAQRQTVSGFRQITCNLT